jgi:hypothetical protein
MIANSDRHENNWIVQNDGKLKLIDHGYSFPREAVGWGGRNAVLPLARTMRVPSMPTLKEDFEKAVPGLKAIGIGDQAIEGARARAKVIADNAGKQFMALPTIYDWGFLGPRVL